MKVALWLLGLCAADAWLRRPAAPLACALYAVKRSGGQQHRSPAKPPAKTPTAAAPTPSAPTAVARPKIFARQTILGQNLVQCRDFKLDSAKTFSFLGSFRSVASLPVYAVPEIAFVGRSNVGKSSLLNAISGANKDIAIASKVPGRTQGINLFQCSDKEGDICVFADLPGYGYAKLSKQQQEEISLFVREYFQRRETLRLVVVIIDTRREALPSDNEMMQFLADEGIPYCVVATKTDKLSSSELSRQLQQLQTQHTLPFPVQPFSAVTGVGVRDVWRLIKDAILARNMFTDGEEEEEDSA